MTDEAFDRQFAALGGIEPSPLVQARTLAAWESTRRRDAWTIRGIAAAGMLAMAAATLLVVDVPDDSGVHPGMVQRGSGEADVRVELTTFVKRGNSVERFAVGESYHVGDTLLFRVVAPRGMKLTLFRGESLVWSGQVPKGASELPVGYALEMGEPAAVFRIEGGTEPVSVSVPPVLP